MFLFSISVQKNDRRFSTRFHVEVVNATTIDAEK